MNQLKPAPGYRWVILALLFFSQMALSIGVYGWGPLGPYLKKNLLLTNIQIGSLTSTLYLSSVICGIPSGICTDRWGVKINLVICMMLMGFALIFAGFAHSYWFLIIMLAFAGASYGMINPLASKGLNIWFDTGLRATAFGIRQMGVTAGGAVAGILVIYLAQLKNWSFAVIVAGALAAVIGIISLVFYKEFPANRGRSAISANSSSKKMGLLDLLQNRNLLLTYLIMMLLCLGQSCICTFFVLYLKEYLQFPALSAGSFFTIIMISGGIGRVFWGLLSDKLFKSRRLPVMKIICIGATISALASFSWKPGWAPFLFIFVAICFGLSYLGFQGIAVVLMVELCGSELAGRSTGLGVTVAWMGMVLGPVIFGTALFSGYPFAWLLVSITSLASIFLCYALNEPESGRLESS